MSMKRYTFADLMLRYGSKQSALSQYIARHKSELAGHSIKTSSGWIFDDYAVGVLDRLKGYNQPLVTPESAEINSLHDTIANLQTALLASQQEALQANKKVIALMEQINNMNVQLTSLQQIKADNQRLHRLLAGQIANIDTAVGKVLLTVTNRQGQQSQGRSGWNRRGQGRRIDLIRVD